MIINIWALYKIPKMNTEYWIIRLR